jgi:exonuclease SbcD
VRWVVADEDRHEVDREAIKRALGRAAGVQLEGRVVPVVRSRAAGISRCVGLANKVRAWARVTSIRPEPLLECLEQLTASDPAKLAASVLGGPSAAADCRGACDRGMDSVRSAATAGVSCDGTAELEVFR